MPRKPALLKLLFFLVPREGPEGPGGPPASLRSEQLVLRIEGCDSAMVNERTCNSLKEIGSWLLKVFVFWFGFSLTRENGASL